MTNFLHKDLSKKDIVVFGLAFIFSIIHTKINQDKSKEDRRVHEEIY